MLESVAMLFPEMVELQSEAKKSSRFSTVCDTCNCHTQAEVGGAQTFYSECTTMIEEPVGYCSFEVKCN